MRGVLECFESYAAMQSFNIFHGHVRHEQHQHLFCSEAKNKELVQMVEVAI